MVRPTGPTGKSRTTNAPNVVRAGANCNELAHCLSALRYLILTSPLPRAFRTADIVASHLKVSMGEEKSLWPGFRLPQLRQLLGKHPELNLMLVRHEPDLSKTIGALTGASLKFRKAATALVDLHQEKGKLLWLIPPRAAAK